MRRGQFALVKSQATGRQTVSEATPVPAREAILDVSSQWRSVSTEKDGRWRGKWPVAEQHRQGEKSSRSGYVPEQQAELLTACRN